jgi:NitT/TauT family transport system ATP-binding protein
MIGIEIEDLSVAFNSGQRSVTALEHVSVSINPGEFVCCVGPSGCGKTTLLRVLAGGLRATSGRIRFGQNGETERAARVGVVFQDHSLLPWRTTLDNVAYGLEVAGMDKQQRRSVAAEYLELVGLAGFASSFPYQLSGGMKQRANLARALAINPDVLLMDEPFAALDAQTKELMQSELLSIWSHTGNTAVFITHQIDEAIYLSDRVVALSRRPGSIKETLTIDLERPRPLSIKRDPRFVQYVDRVWSLLDHDIRAAAQADEPGLESAQ